MTDIKGIVFHTFGDTEEILHDWLNKATGINWTRGFPETYKPGPKLKKPISKGHTGAQLESEMVDRLKEYKRRFEGFEVILLEDDLDYEPWKKCNPPATIEEREAHAKEWLLEKKYKELLPKVHTAYTADVQLVLLYASPEIETWFLADWENGMGTLCDDKEFCSALQRCVADKLSEYYDINIELWHYHPDKQIKFSDLIINMGVDLQMMMEDGNGNIPWEKYFSIDERKRIDGRKYKYKKTEHGKRMLANIDPNVIYDKCPIFFRHAIDRINEIKQMSQGAAP